MTRLEAWHSLAAHAYYGSAVKRLSVDEKFIAMFRLAEFDKLDGDAFSLAVNRLWLDEPSKPKNYRIIIELLTAANSIVLNAEKNK